MNDLYTLDYDTYFYMYNAHMIGLDFMGAERDMRKRIKDLKRHIKEMAIQMNLDKKNKLVDVSINGIEPAEFDPEPWIIDSAAPEIGPGEPLEMNLEKPDMDMTELHMRLDKPHEELTKLDMNLEKSDHIDFEMDLNLEKPDQELSELEMNLDKPEQEMTNLEMNLSKEKQELTGLEMNLDKPEEDMSGLEMNLEKSN